MEINIGNQDIDKLRISGMNEQQFVKGTIKGPPLQVHQNLADQINQIIKKKQEAKGTKNNFSDSEYQKLLQQEFQKEFVNQSIILIHYGIQINKYVSNSNQYHRRTFYIHEEDEDILQWLSEGKQHNKCRLSLSNIKDIDDTVKSKHIKLTDQNKNLYLNIHTLQADIHLMFDNINEKHLFWKGIQQQIQINNRQIEMDKQRNQSSFQAKTLFLQADHDGSKSLDYKEALNVLKKLHIEINKKSVKTIFEKYDKDKSGCIEINEFSHIMMDIMKKTELQQIFKKYANEADDDHLDEKPIMKVFEFRKFLEEEQKQFYVTDAQVLQKISEFCEGNINIPDDAIYDYSFSYLVFCNYIFSRINSIFEPKKMILYQDMNRPLSDYYICSSHNTYLMSNQLTGESSLQAYINAFQKGCRCVELDVWDGDGEPIIYHGHTLTSKIKFKDVCKIIKDYAFQSSEYPLIMSLENHCSSKFQQKMSDILQEVLGALIYQIPKNADECKYYPSPNQLKNKILIKDKGNFNKCFKSLYCQDEEKKNEHEHSEEDKEEEQEEQKEQQQQLQQSQQNQQQQQSIQNDKQKSIQYDKQQIEEMEKDMMKTVQKENQFLNENASVHNVSNTIQQQEQQQQQKLQQIIIINNNNNKNQQNINEQILQTNINHQFANRIQKQKISQQVHQKDLNESVVIPILNDEEFNSIISPIQQNKEIIIYDQIQLINQQNQQQIKPTKENKHLALLQQLCFFGGHLNLKDYSKRKCWEISSINEDKIKSLYLEKQEKIIDFHKQHFTRTYPGGARMDSSNYDPIYPFLSGAQVIALNFQTNDMPLLLLLSKFQENGGVQCGFLLKPEWMLSNTQKALYPNTFQQPKKILKLKIISAQQLRPEDENNVNDVVDPFVKVTIRGTEIDEKQNPDQETDIVENNGFNPQFQKGDMEFKICCPDLCMIVFQVFDKDIGANEVLGRYAINFNCLREGYRVIPLLNTNFEIIEFCYILIKCSIEDCK